MKQQLPLNRADFIYALALAQEHHRRLGILRVDNAHSAARAACRELRELRGVKRLPGGVRAFTQQIEAALLLRRERWLRNPSGDDLPLRERHVEWITDLVRTAFYRADYRSGARVIVRRGDFLPDCVGGYNVYTRYGQYSLTVTKRWYRNVHKQRIAVVDERFVLDAVEDDPIKDSPVFRATWVEKSRGFELRPVEGLICIPFFAPGDLAGSAFLVAPDARHQSVVVLRRRAEKLLRTRLYQTYKARRKEVHRG